MSAGFSIHDVSAAASIAKTTMEKWISLGFFIPDNAAASGPHGRHFTFSDALRLVAMADLRRAGVGPRKAGLIVREINLAASVVFVFQAKDGFVLRAFSEWPQSGHGFCRTCAAIVLDLSAARRLLVSFMSRSRRGE